MVKPSFTFKVNCHVLGVKVTMAVKLENTAFAFDFTSQLFISSWQFFGYLQSFKIANAGFYKQNPVSGGKKKKGKTQWSL